MPVVKVPAAGGLAQADQNRQAGRIESRSSGGSTPWQAHRVVLLQLLLGEHAPSARRHAMQLVLVRLSDLTDLALLCRPAPHAARTRLPESPCHSRLLAADHLLEVEQRQLPLDLLHGGDAAVGAALQATAG